MQIFYWIMLLIAIGIAIFALQNSNIPLITIKFLIWRFETSLIYTILGSIGIGILMTLFLWIPRAVKASIRSKELKKKIENLETILRRPAGLGQEGIKPKEL
jgi:putative membrane protein